MFPNTITDKVRIYYEKQFSADLFDSTIRQDRQIADEYRVNMNMKPSSEHCSQKDLKLEESGEQSLFMKDLKDKYIINVKNKDYYMFLWLTILCLLLVVGIVQFLAKAALYSCYGNQLKLTIRCRLL